MDLWVAMLLLVTGVIAGALNAVAGGATFFTFPALIAVGLPPFVANATNFVALVPSNFAALPAFRPELKEIGKAIIKPLAVAGGGGLIGALILVSLGGGLFALAVPYLMAFATLLFAVAPRIRRAMVRNGAHLRSGGAPGLVLLFVLSVYGGYFGAGLGQVIMAALFINGYDKFHTANALKNAVIAAISIMAVLVYGLSDAVAWGHAVVMMIGATVGGYAGGSVSKHVPQWALRLSTIVFGAFLSIYYFVYGV